MKKILFFVIAHILVAISPFLPTVGDWWAAMATSPMQALVLASGIYFALVTCQLGWNNLDASHAWEKAQTTTAERLQSLQAELKSIGEKVDGAKISLLRDDEFYSEFLTVCENAEHSVMISYLAPKPPDPANTIRAKYYAEILELIKNKPKVRFWRIIRDSPENRKWAAEMLEALKGRSNADVFLLDKDLDSKKEMPLSLSCQIVDMQSAWFVAVSSHERDAEYRDVVVHSREFASHMVAYYRRIEKYSVPLMHAGVLTAKGNALIAAISPPPPPPPPPPVP